MSFDSLVLGARSGQDFRSLWSPRVYGDSSTAFENKITDRFFEVAIAAASVTVVHPVNSRLWSFTLATRHSGVCHTVTQPSLLTGTGFSPTRLGSSLLLAQAVFLLRTSFLCASSGLVHCFCLCAPNHDAHELDLHVGNLASSPLTKQKKTQRQHRVAAYATPSRPVDVTPGLRLLGVRIREVLEEFVYDPEFHAPSSSQLWTRVPIRFSWLRDAKSFLWQDASSDDHSMSVTVIPFPSRGVRVSGNRRKRNCDSCTRLRFSFVTFETDLFKALFVTRVRADDATAESLEELDVSFLRTLHVNNVDRVVVRLQVFASLKWWMGILVQRHGECEVNSLTSSVLIEPAKNKASFFDGVFIFFALDMVENVFA